MGKAITIQRRMAGLCRCGGKPQVGKKTCESCIQAAVVATRRLMAERKAVGLCRCGAPRTEGSQRCEGCSAAHAARVARSQKANKAAGLCSCGQPPEAGKRACSRCLLRRRKLSEKHKATGVCISCHFRGPQPGLAVCDHCREKNRAKGAEIRARYRKAVLDHYGRRCACCGETENEFLTLDHKDNDGAEHRKVVDGGKFYRWLIKSGFPENFQVLCMNCNWAKGRYGECPHNRARLQSLVT
jgi:hypothetical protein